MSDPRRNKVLVVFGTRPEAIKLFRVVRALGETPGIAVRTCVTAQHRGLLDQVLAIADLAPDVDLDLYDVRGIWPDRPKPGSAPVAIRLAG